MNFSNENSKLENKKSYLLKYTGAANDRVMNLINPIFIIPALTGPFFMMIGALMLKFPPKTINGIYGYRTPNSMKSQERWDYSQRYSAKEMIKLGGILSLTSLISIFYHPNEVIGSIIGISLMITMIIILVMKTERAIKKTFSKNQVRQTP